MLNMYIYTAKKSCIKVTGSLTPVTRLKLPQFCEGY